MISRRSFVASSVTLLWSANAKATSPITCVLAGDSHSHMMGPAFRRQAVDYSITATVAAKGGSSVKQWLDQKLLKKLIAQFPKLDTFLISLGTNCWRGERPKLKEHIEALVEGINPDKIVWLLPPPLGMDTQYLHDAVRATELFAIDPGPLPMLSDQIHATPRGYELWAKIIAQTIWT